MRVRYARWSGTQEPFPAVIGADDVLDAMGEDLVDGVSPEAALRRLVGRGLQGKVSGLSDLRRRVEEAQRREAGRMGVAEPLREVAQRLAEILERERIALEFDVRPGVEERRQHLDELPVPVAARLAALGDYRWTDRQAGQDYRALMDDLRRDVAGATFGRLAQALGSMGPEDLARMQAMLSELNALIEADAAGEDTTEAFRDFSDRYADLLPGDHETLEDLLAELARRMAAMSRMMAGLDQDQREQLAAMAEQLLGGSAVSDEAEALRQALQARFPGLGWDQDVQGMDAFGPPGGSLSKTVDWVEHLAELDDLARALAQDYPGARLEDIDADSLRRALGDEAVRDLAGLRQIERVLSEAGALRRNQGRLELTPRGVRKLGERALVRVFERTIGAAGGSHGTPAGGGDGELTGATRPLRFGDPFRLDVGRTIGNAIMRQAAEDGPGPGGGAVRLDAGDFELAEAERRVRAATVLLLDMSFSMPLRGNWGPAKRVALALQALISSRFPEDRFYVVGFSDYARRLQPADLLTAGWERVYGTNMEHAFILARRLLGAHPADEHQIIMITDGEPTAHLEGDAAVFAWPPDPETLRRTLVEAARLARTGATMNVFLLDHDPGAAAFVERMAAAYGGRIFYPDLDDLGSLVVRDFLHRRSA